MDGLLVLDFDHTVVDDNTDTFVMKLGKDGTIPPEVRETYRKGKWTAFMNNVFEYLHNECNVSKEDFKIMLEKMPLTSNMDELLRFARDCSSKTDCIIISDSNSWFIHVIMASKRLLDVPLEVFTNEASFESNGVLKVTPHHVHSHQTCPENMCKGEILKAFIRRQKEHGKEYHYVCYVGDGGNDFCPAMTLGKDDFLFARKGYNLHKKLETSQVSENSPLKCKVFIWENGLEIVSVLKDLSSAAKA